MKWKTDRTPLLAKPGLTTNHATPDSAAGAVSTGMIRIAALVARCTTLVVARCVNTSGVVRSGSHDTYKLADRMGPGADIAGREFGFIRNQAV